MERSNLKGLVGGTLIIDEFAGIPLSDLVDKEKKANLNRPSSPRQYGTFKTMTKKKRKVKVRGK